MLVFSNYYMNTAKKKKRKGKEKKRVKIGKKNLIGVKNFKS